MAIRRFKSETSAESFAGKVDGVVKDLRPFPDSKSNFKVTYTPKKGNKRPLDTPHPSTWAPEDDMDFGYPNEFWQ